MGNGYKGEQKRSCPELLGKKVPLLVNCKETPEPKLSQASLCKDQVTEQREPSPSVGQWGTGTARGGLPGLVRVPEVRRGSSGQRGQPLTWAGYCKPPLFINMFSAQIYSAGRHLLLAFKQGLAHGDG